VINPSALPFYTKRLLPGVFVMSLALKHYLNPLHVYCRLRNLGLTKGHAGYICRIYERAIFRPLILRETADL